MTLSFFSFFFLVLFFIHCAAIINRTIDHHQHWNDHVLNIQTASIMDEAQGHRLCSACRSKRLTPALVYSLLLFSSHLTSLTSPPFHSTCNMRLSSRSKESHTTSQSQLSKSQRKWQKKRTQRPSPKQFNRRMWKETDNAFVANITADTQPRGRKTITNTTAKQKKKRGDVLKKERVFFLF